VALRLVYRKLADPAVGVVADLSEIRAIGHRVVHGGERFQDPVLVTAEVKNAIREFVPLAPLHNPANLGGIEACERAFPGVPNVAVFDTAFHQTMKPEVYLFALPQELYQKYRIRKYGFHGTSHKFVYAATAAFLHQDPDRVRLITCHLGNGCSMAAIDGGRVLDTSMGMTPLMGLMMGTRCGDIDPGVVLYLLHQGLRLDQLDELLNKQSGLLGVAGIGSSDVRDILGSARAGSEMAQRAVDMFVYRLVAYIGAYYAALQGVDALVFTGGIGENSASIRERVVKRLGVLGCFLDRQANEAASGTSAVISTADSRMKAVVMPTNEELMIALEAVRVLGL
jgi:acetate kinase